MTGIDYLQTLHTKQILNLKCGGRDRLGDKDTIPRADRGYTIFK
jgi:hypothetical protein